MAVSAFGAWCRLLGREPHRTSHHGSASTGGGASAASAVAVASAASGASGPADGASRVATAAPCSTAESGAPGLMSSPAPASAPTSLRASISPPACRLCRATAHLRESSRRCRVTDAPAPGRVLRLVLHDVPRGPHAGRRALADERRLDDPPVGLLV